MSVETGDWPSLFHMIQAGLMVRQKFTPVFLRQSQDCEFDQMRMMFG
jgi:hypothetical protein